MLEPPSGKGSYQLKYCKEKAAGFTQANTFWVVVKHFVKCSGAKTS
jgi:stalled ribosome alternative rescue factor ArfA